MQTEMFKTLMDKIEHELKEKKFKALRDRLEALGMLDILDNFKKRRFQKLIRYIDSNYNEYYYADDDTFNGKFIIGFLYQAGEIQTGDNPAAFSLRYEQVYKVFYDEVLVPAEIRNHQPGLEFS